MANDAMRVLLQTTIGNDADDWNIGRFALLTGYLRGLTDIDGAPLVEVTARNREPGPDGVDPVLGALDTSGFDQLWLFAVDVGGETGITAAECAAIGRFRERGGAVFTTRDHHDLGLSMCDLAGVGRAHYFHSKQHDPDPDRNRRDDEAAANIDFPNYHSGANGDVQRVIAPLPVHPVLTGVATLPAHPHEGGVGAPADDANARVVATGVSQTTGRTFAIAVAFASDGAAGRGWAESTFHHFCDYNWDVRAGCPSFVAEPPSDAIVRDPHLLDDTKRYVANLVRWLGRKDVLAA